MKTILVVDDNPVSRELICEVLDSPEFRILQAQDGKSALESMSESPPDLVLIDIQMPVMDGFATLARLRTDARFQSLPVVAVTAFAMRGDREKAIEAGFTSYITKPIDVLELERLVRGYLAGESNGAMPNGF
jgi:CheY-like chemotaxis protein